jgi:beta-glucosidase
MTIDTSYVIPWNISDPQDHQAVDISLAFQYAWLADPQVFGRYPPEMTSRVTGGRLPTFNETESQIMKGSFDFLGVNYYTTYYVHYTGIIGDNYGNDGRYWTSQYNASGNLIGPQGASNWLFVYPPGIRGLLKWLKHRYNNIEMYVLENGVSIPGENLLPPSLALNDTFRMNYIFDHVMEVVDSVLNNFEWTEGYHIKFGMTYVNFNDSLTRTVKDSGYMYSNLIQYLGSEGAEKKEGILPAGKLKEYLMLDS